MKVVVTDLRVVHWDHDGTRPERATNHDFYFDLISGKDISTFILTGVKIKWTYRLHKEGATFLSFIAEDVYKIVGIQSMGFEAFKKVVLESFWRMVDEYKSRMKPYGDYTIFFDPPIDELKESFDVLKSA